MNETTERSAYDKLSPQRKQLADMLVANLDGGGLWKQGWRTRGAPENAVTGKKYRGVNNLYLFLVAMERGYSDNRWLTFNQMKARDWSFKTDAEGKRPKLKEKLVECFTLAEQKNIEQAILNGKKDKLYGIILCLYSGLRIGELIALQWSDIDFVKGILTVSKSCHDGKDWLIIDEPKTTTSRRVIPLPKQLLPILKGIKKKSDSPFVVSANGKPVSVRSYQRSFELLLKRLNIPHKGFHSLRHTFATRARECGMDVKTLSEILGHKNPTVTLNRYAHSLMEHKADMMNRLGKLL